jgi:hypothetical protein
VGVGIISKNDVETTEVQHIYREKTDKRILKKNPWKDYGLHLTVLLLVVIAMLIGPREIRISQGIEVSIMPLLYTMVLGLVFYLAKPIKWIQRKQSRVAEGAMMLFIGILIAKLAVSSGSSIHLIFEMGPALMLQELGHLATILIALPVALLLGFSIHIVYNLSLVYNSPLIVVCLAVFAFIALTYLVFHIDELYMK